MNTTDKIAEMEDQPYNGFKNLYQAMCVKQDYTSCDDVFFYDNEALALEVV